MMISVGIDISKGKSTACILKSDGEIVEGPITFKHTTYGLKQFIDQIPKGENEVKVVMEATGIYHLQVAIYLQEQGYFVAIVNPLAMKRFRTFSIRGVKTDKVDAMKIAEYGLARWNQLSAFQIAEDKYAELSILSRQYRHHMENRIRNLQDLIHMLDQTMPGIKKEFNSLNEANGKDKLLDFAKKYWHFDTITKKSERAFVNSYVKWAKKMGYRPNPNKATKIYSIAKEGIPSLPANQTTKMLVEEAADVLKRANEALIKIITRIKTIAKSLPEYQVVRDMGGVGDTLAPRLIADIGDVRRFKSAKSLVAYAGIDAPPYQSGQFIGTRRHISKRGSSAIRKTGYEVMRSLKSHAEPKDNAVYQFILKKEAEGKAKKVAKIAGLNKFLRIYYTRVMAVYGC
ncbi:MAG: IS110 family transposase [Pseudoramibacter sp.]